jgi:hypothetical protein
MPEGGGYHAGGEGADEGRKMKGMGDSAEKIHAITGLPTGTIEQLPND